MVTPIYYYEMSGQMKTMIDRAQIACMIRIINLRIFICWTTAAEDELKFRIGDRWFDRMDRLFLIERIFQEAVFAGGVNESGTIKLSEMNKNKKNIDNYFHT